MLRKGVVILAIVLVAGASAKSPLLAQVAQVNASQEVELGVIVTATAEQAAGVLKELKSGMDFGVLAKEKSIDGNAKDGGYMGRFNPAQLQPELRDALKGVTTGQFTDVVHISAGFVVLAVLPAVPNTKDLNPDRIRALVTSGTMRTNIDISGLAEADSVLQQYPKGRNWNHDLRQMCAARTQSTPLGVQSISQLLAETKTNPTPDMTPLDIIHGHAALAQLHGYMGDMDKAIDEWKTALKLAQETVPESLPYVQESLGIAYLHKSELENGIYRDSTDMDLFPPPNLHAHYTKQEDSEQAIQYFLQYLEQKPDSLEIRWLLNLAYATLGEYPAKVPPNYLISPSAFESKENIGRFPDVAPAAGLNVFAEAGGVVVEDFDNDGLLDVITSSFDECEPLHFFHNNGDGTFTDRNVQAGLAGQTGGLNLIQADYNNDGCMDLLVLRGGWEYPMRKSLLRNNCDGTFTDVTMESGLGDTVTSTGTAAFVDIDNDGFLDLFIGNENSPAQLFRNKGDGTFEDISHAAGIDRTAFIKGVAAADYDNDGYVDFYLSNYAGANLLYHNNHDRTFTEIGRQAGVQAPWFSFATWFFDYDNDGWPDLFVTCYLGSTDEIMRSYLKLPVHAETLKLYRNMHNGTFKDVSAEVGLDRVFLPMGANFGDVDNDGFLDIYMGMGQPSFAALTPHVLMRNKEGKSFVDITASSGTGELHKGHGISFADLERNGHEDILAQIGGAVPSDRHSLRVFQNPGNDNDWINVRLTGVKSNHSAVGAQIKVTVEDDRHPARSIYRTVGGTSSFGGNPLEQHIGLGHGARIVSLDIWWPATNSRQHFASVDKNQFIAIKEFANDYTTLDRKPYRIGRGKTIAAAR